MINIDSELFEKVDKIICKLTTGELLTFTNVTALTDVREGLLVTYEHDGVAMCALIRETLIAYLILAMKEGEKWES